MYVSVQIKLRSDSDNSPPARSSIKLDLRSPGIVCLSLTNPDRVVEVQLEDLETAVAVLKAAK